MDMYIKNPSVPEFLVESPSRKNGIKWSIQYQQIKDSFRARTADVTLPRRIPAKQFGEVILWDANRPAFRGYIEQYEVDGARTKKLTVQGIEKLLEYRYTPDLFYPSGTTFSELLSDECTINDLPGLLAIANGGLPVGWRFSFKDSTTNIVCLGECGTESRFGNCNLFFIGYQYLRELVAVHDVDELAYIDLTYFRNTDDLYIRIDHDYSRGWYDHGYLICENVFDTGIRLGSCPSDSLDGDLTITVGEYNIADIITGTMRAHNYYLHLRDEADGLYIDIDSEEGRDGPV